MKTQTQVQHTPGPWYTVTRQRVGTMDCDIHIGAKTTDVCVVGRQSDERFHIRDSATESANARLIAAAPELLLALQHIDSNAAESVEWIRRVARAAIAKATA